MKSVMEHGEVVERYLGKEQEAQRVLGPFKHSLFPEENGDSSSTVLTMGLRKNYVLSHMSQLMT